MSISSVTSTLPNPVTPAAVSSAASSAGISSSDFLNLLVGELQNQDPTQPMSNQDLLSQLSTMSQLQSTQDLDTALQSNTNNQQLSTAASFIGKAVQGKDSHNNPVTGIASEALLQSGTAYVTVNNSLVPLANITAVAPAQ